MRFAQKFSIPKSGFFPCESFILTGRQFIVKSYRFQTWRMVENNLAMLLPNNPELPLDEIEQKLKRVIRDRRRTSVFLSKSTMAAIKITAAPVIEPRGLRAFIKRQPFIGPMALGIYRTLRQLSTPGMGWKQKLRLVPGLGACAIWVYSLLRLNAVRAQIAHELAELRQMQAANTAVAQNLSYRIDNFDRVDIAQRLHQLDQIDIANRLQKIDQLDVENRLDQLDQLDLKARQRQFDQLNIANRLNEFDQLDLANRLRHFDQLDIGNRLQHIDSMHLDMRADQAEMALRQFEKKMRDVELHNVERDHRIAGLAMEVRIKLQRATIVGTPPVWASPTFVPPLPGFVPPSVARVAPAESLDLNSFYYEFEALFRGSRDSIKQRLEVYLDQLADLPADPHARAVDVGCGRGEWIELLRDHGIACTGVDLNAVMVDECLALGFDAVCADAIAYLHAQPADSLAVVSGFHIIEHIPFENLIALFDAALHALRPGGVLIFETPNPENLVVGACNFYYDPTHLHPIVPAVAEFMARQRGFASAQILRLHPYPDDHLLTEDSETARRLNKALYGPQDYAVIARKPHAH